MICAVSTLAKAGPGVRFNEHLECDDGDGLRGELLNKIPNK